ncbi:hypothetical protein Pcinc_031562 [Petrolisthes cinctipes]|uniref:Uncharacterized protein n=1 Tax=Petrolisthes cinctipes TaxID=88211 RepID=A0AAE1EWC6_PETCI|nr:hypothetical protein Pcinc_031562 [Petrolisthes cinctipes]
MNHLGQAGYKKLWSLTNVCCDSDGLRVCVCVFVRKGTDGGRNSCDQCVARRGRAMCPPKITTTVAASQSYESPFTVSRLSTGSCHPISYFPAYCVCCKQLPGSSCMLDRQLHCTQHYEHNGNYSRYNSSPQPIFPSPNPN